MGSKLIATEKGWRIVVTVNPDDIRLFLVAPACEVVSQIVRHGYNSKSGTDNSNNSENGFFRDSKCLFCHERLSSAT